MCNIHIDNMATDTTKQYFHLCEVVELESIAAFRNCSYSGVGICNIGLPSVFKTNAFSFSSGKSSTESLPRGILLFSFLIMIMVRHH